jgi:hypothetical protein
MKRLAVALLTLASLAAPLAAEAQQRVGKLSRIGVLMSLYPPDADPPRTLRQRLRDLGYVERQNLVIDWRYRLGPSNRLPTLAAELVRLTPQTRTAAGLYEVAPACTFRLFFPSQIVHDHVAVGDCVLVDNGKAFYCIDVEEGRVATAIGKKVSTPDGSDRNDQ